MLHASAAVALLGASVHNGVICVRHRLGWPVRRKLRRLYPTLVLPLFALTLLLGAYLYPEFRVHVRAEYLDAAMPWATIAFEVKEHLVSLAGLTLLMQVGLLRTRDADGPWFDGAGVFVAFATVYSGLVGLWLVSVRSV